MTTLLVITRLEPRTNIDEWFARVNGGVFAKNYPELLKEKDWWHLSTINLEDLEADHSATPDMNKQLVAYLRAFSHFRAPFFNLSFIVVLCHSHRSAGYHKLARSLRMHPRDLQRKDWIRISLHAPEELIRNGNVPEPVAHNMRDQAFKHRGY